MILVAELRAVRLSTSSRSARRGELAGDNPWDAGTLEWATTSPPPPLQLRAHPGRHQPRAALGRARDAAGRRRACASTTASCSSRTRGGGARRTCARPRPSRRSGRSSRRSPSAVLFIGSIFTPWAVVWGVDPGRDRADRLVLAEGHAGGRGVRQRASSLDVSALPTFAFGSAEPDVVGHARLHARSRASASRSRSRPTSTSPASTRSGR